MTREEAKEIMLKLLSEITNDFDVLEDEEKEAFNMAIKALEQEQKIGHWEDCSNGWMCSVCERDNRKDTNYCPNCGARMEGGA